MRVELVAKAGEEFESHYIYVLCAHHPANGIIAILAVTNACCHGARASDGHNKGFAALPSPVPSRVKCDD